MTPWRYSTRAARNRRAVLREWREAIEDGAYQLADEIVLANIDIFEADHYGGTGEEAEP